MQQTQLDANQDTIQTTIDVCLHLAYFRNLTENKLGPVQIVISVVSGQSSTAIPYQVISNESYKTTSKIDLESYSSPFYVLQPREYSIIDEMVIFKMHIPIDLVETGRTKVTIGLQTVNQLAADEEDSRKRLDQVQLNFNSILYIDSFFPCTFSSCGISLEGRVFTHLLRCKHGNLDNIYRHHIYQGIDHMVISYNKLREKINTLQNSSSQSEMNSLDLPAYIDMKNYQEYQQIREFIQKRIFQQQTMKEHKEVLSSFIPRFLPEMSQKLLILWKYFLKMDSFSMTENAKRQFYQRLTLELKKRVQYKNQTPQISRSQIQNKGSPSSFSTSENSHSSSSSVSQTLIQCQSAENDLRQRFHDRNLQHPVNKLNISNLQLPYPSIKVLVNKCLKTGQKNDVITANQPHIIVLVHGLGATSNSFNQFQTNMKNVYSQNLIIINSAYNQNLANQEMQEIGRKLAISIYQFIVQNNFGQNFRLSFLGHSLGGLIIRSALPKLEMFKSNMKTLITLSTPHLGYFYHSANLNQAGMQAISKFSNNQIINTLLTDSQNPKIDEETGFRNSYLYALSTAQGLGWFQHVMFCGSPQDHLVSPLSAFASTKQSIRNKKDIKSQIWQEMRLNIQAHINETNTYRLLIQFNQKQQQAGLKDQMLGGTSNVEYLSSKDFTTYLLLVYEDLFI